MADAARFRSAIESLCPESIFTRHCPGQIPSRNVSPAHFPPQVENWRLARADRFILYK